VNGNGFISSSVVNWNGSARTTTFVSSTQLQAAISATDIASAGADQVTVTNPAPGGGTSGKSAFNVLALPAISSLSPSTATAGGSAFTLTVNGSGFVSGSTVNWNGAARTTTFVNSKQLKVAILSTDIAMATTAQVTVSNPASGGGTSGSFAFTVTNPMPSVSSMNPSTTTAGSSGFILTVNGSGFVNNSVVNWNGSPRTTTFVSATQLQAAISATDIATSGMDQVTLNNPSPGGGTSGSVSFSVTSSTTTATAPAAAYSFSEGVGSTTADSSGNGNTGVLQGPTWTTSGKYGDALYYNGVNAYVDLGNPASLQSQGSMTWAAWVYMTGWPTTNCQIVSRANSTGGWSLRASWDSGVRSFAVSVAGSSGQAVRYSNTVPSLNTWYYVAGVYDANGKNLDIYVNGVLDDGVLSGKIPKNQTLVNVNTTIGKASNGQFFFGTIDELHIYTTALSLSAIQKAMTTLPSQPVKTTLTATVLPTSPSDARTTPLSTKVPEVEGSRTAGTTTLSCSPKTVDAGSRTTCQLQIPARPVAVPIQLTPSSADVKIPALVSSRPNQTSLTFQVWTEPAARQQMAVITANLGDNSAYDTILVMPAARPVLKVPANKIGRFGNPLAFDVLALDPSDLPLQLAATALPSGASFNTSSGRFEWTPTEAQAGIYHVDFVATNSAGQSSSGRVRIEVDSANPVLTPSPDLACSPGAVAELTGKWLTAPGATFSDLSGNSKDLGGTRVTVNDQHAPVLFASDTLVRFLCPRLEPGAQIKVSVTTSSATSNALISTMQTASPQILSLDRSEPLQGMISFPGTTEIAMDRNFLIPAHPAQPGDQILIWATGLDAVSHTPGTMSVRLGGVYAPIDSVESVPGFAGVYTIQVRVPDGAAPGRAVPAQLDVASPDGRWFTSRPVSLVIESSSQ